MPLGHAACARDLAARLGPAGRLREWAGPGTFHGKGVWLFEKGRVAATVLGSSNFNARSRDRDLELGAVLLPRDAGLGRALAAEWRALAADARAGRRGAALVARPAPAAPAAVFVTCGFFAVVAS